MNSHILIIDDDEVSSGLLGGILTTLGYTVTATLTGEDGLKRLREDTYDLLLVDVRLPGIDGLEVTRIARERYPHVPVVVVSAYTSMETAINAINEGAFDYIAKPVNPDELDETVARALTPRALLDKHPEQAKKQPEETGHRVIIGRSPAMVNIYKTVARVARTNSTILILGESGTGKELIARAIHQHSFRARRPFVAVDCGALSETLLESELFGHVRGSFTGAISDKKGVFEQAEGGTCFLDEIGNISPVMQAKLLRILQEGEIKRVGGQQWLRVDVRIVAATNKDLLDLVDKGTFRQDLYYRLKVIAISLPPLRERADDIPALTSFFCQRYSQANEKHVTAIAEETMALLSAYSWPGNVRELQNAVERAVAMATQPILIPTDLPAEISNGKQPSRTNNASSPFAGTPSLAEIKKRYILHILAQTQGNVSRAAEVLEVDRRSLYRMLERYDIKTTHKA